MRTGTKQPAISRLERDEVSPTVETLQLLMNAMGEQLEIGGAPLVRNYDPLHREASAKRSPEERLGLAMSWNRLAGRLAEAGKRTRAGG